VPRLTESELTSVRRALGPTASMLASAVAKLYTCPRGGEAYTWTGVWGALVLVVDRTPPTSKAIQIYTLHSPAVAGVECVCSVQLYESLTYLAPNHLFHTFEVDEGLVGLSFGDADHAHQFLVKVRAHIPAHGSVPARRPAKKASFLSRLFGGGGGSSASEQTHNSKDGISAPSAVVKHDLPEEWQTLFKNAAAIASNKAAEQRQQARQPSGAHST
jgi:hypothetical protein